MEQVIRELVCRYTIRIHSIIDVFLKFTGDCCIVLLVEVFIVTVILLFFGFASQVTRRLKFWRNNYLLAEHATFDASLSGRLVYFLCA